jgi:hypothetical protein
MQAVAHSKAASPMDIEIRELGAEEGREHVSALAEVLVDCVEGGRR